MKNDLQTLRARIKLLEDVCAQAYQFAGAVGAPERVLDNLWAAAEGHPLPHESFLPVTAEECDEGIDFSDIPEMSPEQLKAMRRVGWVRRVKWVGVDRIAKEMADEILRDPAFRAEMRALIQRAFTQTVAEVTQERPENGA